MDSTELFAPTGVLLTDERAVDSFGTTCWGAETLSVAERHYKIIMAGVDQFGGNNDAGPVLEAYQMGVKEHGEEFMRDTYGTICCPTFKKHHSSRSF